MKTLKITAKDHKEYKQWALKTCQDKLVKLSEKGRMELALKLDLSFNTIQLYKNGKGNNIETALKIIESL
jgi:hypothetical protein